MRSRLLTRLGAVAAVALVCDAALAPELAGLPTAQLAARANALLAAGSSAQALELFDAAIERDGASDYSLLYKRAVVYQSLGQTRRALDDLEAVLRLSDYEQARVQIARIRLKNGELDEAKAAVDALLKANKKHADALALRTTISDAGKHVAAARKAHKSRAFEVCVASATQAIEASPQAVELRDLRAACSLALGRVDEAVGDVTRAASLDPAGAARHVRLARRNNHYAASESERGIQPLQQCLRYDPESRPCKAAFRLLRSLDKDRGRARNHLEAGQWRAAADVLGGAKGLVERVRAAVADAAAADPSEPGEARAALLTALLGDACKALVRAGGPARAAAATCEELLRRDPDNVDGLVGRGEDLLRQEDYDAAVRAFADAFEKTGRSDRDVLGRLQNAQKLLKRSKAKDYYKVLGVARDADERTIKKAYRRATIKAHPDKPGGSEAKMAALNEAHEVLSNPELRARYDNGDDPNEPQQGGGNPFGQHGGAQHVFFQQGGGGGGSPFESFFQQQGFPGGGGQHFSFKFG